MKEENAIAEESMVRGYRCAFTNTKGVSKKERVLPCHSTWKRSFEPRENNW